jgi:hypothetical protein
MMGTQADHWGDRAEMIMREHIYVIVRIAVRTACDMLQDYYAKPDRH